jgi:hypothetical protein
MLDALTEMFPDEYAAGNVTLIAVVPCPELITAPDGTAHI